MMPRRSLQTRILILVALGIVLLFATIGTAAYLTVRTSIDRLLHERLALAQATADSLERALQLSLRRMANTVGPNFDLSEGLDAERKALQQAGWDSIFGDTVFLLDAQGKLLDHWPPGVRTVEPDVIAREIREALQGTTMVSGVVDLGPTGRKAVAGLQPLRDRDGKVMGIVGGTIDLTGSRLREQIEPRTIDTAQSVDVVDDKGTVLASTQPSHLFAIDDHRNLVAGLIRNGRSTVVECHNCHESEQEGVDVMALSPLASIRWAVLIRQSRDTVLRPANILRDAVLVIAVIFLLGASIVVIASVRSVVRPIRMLTRKVRAISSGDLNSAVPPMGEDEIGELGRHVESMRVRLRDSLAEIRRWNEQLGQEVARRTAQTEAVASQNAVLYHELQRKDAARSQLLRKIITAPEDERKRVARDLHDSTSQELAALLLRIDALRDAHPDEAAQIEPVKALAAEILDEIHRLIFDLRPALLDDLGLAPALQWLCQKQFGGTSTDCRFEVTNADPHTVGEGRLPAQMETTLFRIAQEAVNNVARHAQATNVIVSLTYGEKGVAIEVEDDGVGFDSAAVQTAGRSGEVRGLGLLGMRERVELWEGTIEVDSAPEQGTRVRAFVPYPKKEEEHAGPNPAGG